MSTILSSYPETSIWSAPSAPLKLYSRARETETTCCAGVTFTKSLERIEIPLSIYDSRDGLGLFSQDPIGFAAGDANLYRYTGNAPTMRTDPSGLDWVKKMKVVIKGGIATFENGKTLVMRNWKYRNKSIGVDDLIEGGTSCDPATLAGIKKAYPDLKIKYNKNAQPDFSEVAKYSVEVKGMTGKHTHDADLALKALENSLTKKQYKDLVDNLSDYRLHHSSTGQILVVPKDIHTVFSHTGAASFLRAAGTSTAAMSYTLFAPGLSDIRSTISDNPNAALDITDAEIVMTAGIDVARWFDPFFESAYECAEADLAVRIPALRKAPETTERARNAGIVPWLDGVFEYWDILTGNW